MQIMTEPDQRAQIIELSEQVGILLAGMVEASAEALHAARSGDGDGAVAALERREPLLERSDQLFRQLGRLRQALTPAGEALYAARLDELEQGVAAIGAIDAQLEFTLAAARQQVGHELEQIEATSQRNTRYQSAPAVAGTTIDLTY